MSKKNDQSIRPAQVRKLVRLMNDEYKAIIFDPNPLRASKRAKALRNAAERNSTPAEIQAAIDKHYRELPSL